MKRILRVLILFLPVCLLLSASAGAAEPILDSEMLDTDHLGTALSGNAADLMEGIAPSEDLDALDDLGKIIERGTASAGSMLRTAVRSGAVMVLISILCAVLSTVYSASGKIPNFVHLVGALGISAVAVSDMSVFVGLGQSTMNELSDFSRALLPTLSSAAALSGAVSSAAAKYATAAFFMELLITLSAKVILPLIFAYTAATIGCAATGSESLAGVAKLIKWAATTVLTLTVTVFVAFLSLIGAASASSDAYSTRFIKSAISTAIPVVGKIASEAAGTIAAGAGLVRNTAGLFGLLAVLAICIVPVLRTGIQYLIYKCASGLAGVLAEKRLTELISGIGSALGLVFGMTGSCALMLFVSILSCIKVVST